MKCVLSRSYTPSETKGYFAVFDGSVLDYHCVTLEPPNLGNQHNISCIPEGQYTVTKENNPEKGMCFRVNNVPNRDGILIHKGNFTKETRGCIICGSYFEDINGDGVLDVVDSTIALNKLLGYLPDSFTLYII
jgi:hypothetical protein